MELSVLFNLFIQALLLVVLVVLAGVLAQVYRIVRDFANITKRVEALSDISGWFSLYKKFTGKK